MLLLWVVLFSLFGTVDPTIAQADFDGIYSVSVSPANVERGASFTITYSRTGTTATNGDSDAVGPDSTDYLSITPSDYTLLKIVLSGPDEKEYEWLSVCWCCGVMSLRTSGYFLRRRTHECLKTA